MPILVPNIPKIYEFMFFSGFVGCFVLFWRSGYKKNSCTFQWFETPFFTDYQLNLKNTFLLVWKKNFVCWIETLSRNIILLSIDVKAMWYFCIINFYCYCIFCINLSLWLAFYPTYIIDIWHCKMKGEAMVMKGSHNGTKWPSTMPTNQNVRNLNCEHNDKIKHASFTGANSHL